MLSKHFEYRLLFTMMIFLLLDNNIFPYLSIENLHYLLVASPF
jgi:hypothetical protein